LGVGILKSARLLNIGSDFGKAFCSPTESVFSHVPRRGRSLIAAPLYIKLRRAFCPFFHDWIELPAEFAEDVSGPQLSY